MMRRPKQRSKRGITGKYPADRQADTIAAQAVRLAKAGDTEAARDILQEFVHALSLGGDRDWHSYFPSPMVHYVADAFRMMLDEGADPARALGLKARKRGRPVGKRTHDPVKLAAAFWLLRRRGKRIEQATESIRKAVGADRTTVQNAVDQCSALEDVDDDVLVAIVAEQPTLQKAIIGT